MNEDPPSPRERNENLLIEEQINQEMNAISSQDEKNGIIRISFKNSF